MDNYTPPPLTPFKPSEHGVVGQIWYKSDVDESWSYLGQNVILYTELSLLLARMLKDLTEPTHGAFGLAVGTGDSGWDPMDPPAASETQGSLYNELDRKPFSTISWIDSGGSVSSIPTNILDFTATFSSTEAVGPLVEMGIICAPTDIVSPYSANPIPQGSWNSAAVDRRNYDSFLAVRNFKVLNKPSGHTYTFSWRVTF
tara:strand:- start:279 stop:878 length:600 start_codon:yes stop_codon:yes gene_type:complete